MPTTVQERRVNRFRKRLRKRPLSPAAKAAIAEVVARNPPPPRAPRPPATPTTAGLDRYSEAWRHRTVTDLARALGYGRQHVSFVLHGKRSPSLDLVRAMARVFATTTDRVLELLPKRGPEPATKEPS